MYDSNVIPFGDSFLLVGGRIKNLEWLSTIYLFNPDDDSWTLLDARVEGEKEGSFSMMVDRNLFEKE
jgi:hypothetical protein